MKRKTSQKLPSQLRTVLEQVLSVPTAPFSEHFLSSHITKRLAKFAPRIRCEEDAFGNLLIRYRGLATAPASFVFQAHLDHPGFTFVRSTGRQEGVAELHGGMSKSIVGGKLQFFQSPTSKGVPATILSSFDENDSRIAFSGQRRLVTIRHREPILPGTLGMWAYPALKEAGGMLEGRAFDDNLSVAILVYLLESSARAKVKQNFDVLFTRAEEVGFIGCLALLKGKSFRLPKTIINLEMPLATSHIESGNGVVVRTGDVYLNYDSEVTAYLAAVAKNCAEESSEFRAQRRLGFTGGTEVSPFLLAGYKAGALCVPVVNAHNRDESGRPCAEKVAVSDVLSLVKMLEVIVQQKPNLKAPIDFMKKRFEVYRRSFEQRLKVSPREWVQAEPNSRKR